jgi:hypothetical protein
MHATHLLNLGLELPDPPLKAGVGGFQLQHAARHSVHPGFHLLHLLTGEDGIIKDKYIDRCVMPLKDCCTDPTRTVCTKSDNADQRGKKL